MGGEGGGELIQTEFSFENRFFFYVKSPPPPPPPHSVAVAIPIEGVPEEKVLL